MREGKGGRESEGKQEMKRKGQKRRRGKKEERDIDGRQKDSRCEVKRVWNSKEEDRCHLNLLSLCKFRNS